MYEIKNICHQQMNWLLEEVFFFLNFRQGEFLNFHASSLLLYYSLSLIVKNSFSLALIPFAVLSFIVKSSQCKDGNAGPRYNPSPPWRECIHSFLHLLTLWLIP